MKPIWLAIGVFAAVAGGGAGGVVATQLMAPARADAPKTIAAKPLDEKAATEVKNYDNDLAQLRNDMKSLSLKLSEAETSAKDSKAELAKAKADYETRIANLEKRPAGTVAAKDGTGGTAPAVAENSPELSAAVEKVLAEREETRRKEREAEQQKWMEDRWVTENTAIATALTEKLSLTPDQQAKVNTLLEGYTNSRRDLMTRGREAMESGTEFDWRAEGTKINTAVTEQVRAELSSAQLSTFNELVGDNGISALAPRGFGGRGPGGGGQGGGGQGGGGQGGGRGGRGN